MPPLEQNPEINPGYHDYAKPPPGMLALGKRRERDGSMTTITDRQMSHLCTHFDGQNSRKR
ncbi:MAG: hypothetical protein MJE68_30205 [Proteobacteria bacterium]|nr:hypothetical protein [Pseudomonadota bacterium]